MAGAGGWAGWPAQKDSRTDSTLTLIALAGWLIHIVLSLAGHSPLTIRDPRSAICDPQLQ